MTTTTDLTVRCGFCIKDRVDVEQMIAGPAVYICNDCVTTCVSILSDSSAPPHGSSLLRWEQMNDDDILARLPQIASVATQIEDNLAAWVQRLRGHGVSWARIGGALGMARQSAWERFANEE